MGKKSIETNLAKFIEQTSSKCTSKQTNIKKNHMFYRLRDMQAFSRQWGDSMQVIDLRVTTSSLKRHFPKFPSVYSFLIAFLSNCSPCFIPAKYSHKEQANSSPWYAQGGLLETVYDCFVNHLMSYECHNYYLHCLLGNLTWRMEHLYYHKVLWTKWQFNATWFTNKLSFILFIIIIISPWITWKCRVHVLLLGGLERSKKSSYFSFQIQLK